MTPVIIRLQWDSEDNMTKALRARIEALPPLGPHSGGWQAISVSATSEDVVVLVVSKVRP